MGKWESKMRGRRDEAKMRSGRERRKWSESEEREKAQSEFLILKI